MSGESEAQNIFPAAFSLMEHTPESSNLQDPRGLGGFRTNYSGGNNPTKLLNGQVWIISMINNNNNK